VVLLPTVAPLPSATVAPLVKVAVEPELVTLTEATWPDVVPSDDVTVWPINCSACDNEVELSRDVNVVFVCTAWPTCEMVASWLTIAVGSMGWVGSWFCISVINKLKKEL
jgi:hypothetical protein